PTGLILLHKPENTSSTTFPLREEMTRRTFIFPGGIIKEMRSPKDRISAGKMCAYRSITRPQTGFHSAGGCRHPGRIFIPLLVPERVRTPFGVCIASYHGLPHTQRPEHTIPD